MAQWAAVLLLLVAAAVVVAVVLSVATKTRKKTGTIRSVASKSWDST